MTFVLNTLHPPLQEMGVDPLILPEEMTHKRVDKQARIKTVSMMQGDDG